MIHYIIIGLLFFISGITGLVYQTIWIKWYNLIFGSHIYSITAVLSAFMIGLSAGSYTAGKFCRNIKNSIKAFAFLELFIAGYCLFFQNIIEFTEILQKTYYLSLIDSPFLIILFRFSIAILILILPTMAMGATLPILTQFLSQKSRQSDLSLSLIYFSNTIGAATGCIIAGFFLIPHYGIQGSCNLTIILNSLVGLIAFFLSGFSPSEATASEVKENSVSTAKTPVDSIIFYSVFITGFVTMGLEILWTRLFSMVFGSSAYTFSLILSAILTGIAVGTILYSLARHFNQTLSIDLLGKILLSISFIISFVTLFIAHSGIINFYIRTHTQFSFFGQMGINMFIIFLLISLPAILFGFAFPLSMGIYQKGYLNAGMDTGKLYSINTIGTITGIISTTFLILPTLGIQFGTLLLSTLIWISGFLFLRKSNSKFSGVLCLIGLILMLTPVLKKWEVSELQAGTFRANINHQSITDRSGELLFHREGIHNTVSVYGEKSDNKNLFFKDYFTKYLVINGKIDGSISETSPDVKTTTLLGFLPQLYSNEKDLDILIIGAGTGMTIGTLLDNPNVKSIDILEISSAVIDSSRLFKEINGDYLNSPKCKIINDDARNYLLYSGKKYDAIVSEPSNPWISGIGSLFSVEASQAITRSLKPNGIGVQWFHVYESNDSIYWAILNTFRSVFPFIELWQVEMGDILLVLSQKPLTYTQNKINKLSQIPGIHNRFLQMGFQYTSFLNCFHLMNSSDFNTYLEEGVIVTDDNLFLEYQAPKAFYEKNKVTLDWPKIQNHFSGEKIRDLTEAINNPEELLELCFALKSITGVMPQELLTKAFKFKKTAKIAELISDTYSQADLDKTIEWLDIAINLEKEKPVTYQIKKLNALHKKALNFYKFGITNQYQEIIDFNNDLIEKQPDNFIMLMGYGDFLVKIKQYREASEIYQKVLHLPPQLNNSELEKYKDKSKNRLNILEKRMLSLKD